jgi:23S rRNA pseudouridine2605 synthase
MRTAERGCKIEGIQYRPFQFRLEQKANTNAWVRMTLTEGKNREVRKILKAHGLDVVRLIRTRYGPYELDGVEKGAVMQVSPRKAFDLLRSKNIRVEDRRSGTLPPADK